MIQEEALMFEISDELQGLGNAASSHPSCSLLQTQMLSQALPGWERHLLEILGEGQSQLSQLSFLKPLGEQARAGQ